MKITCNIIRDILPLYAEDMVCEETKALVDEHLCGCDECTKELAALKKKESIPVSADTAPMEHIRKTILKRQILTTVCVILTIVSLIWSGMVFMTAPIYLPSEKAIEGVELREDGGLAIDYASGIMGHGGGSIEGDKLCFVYTTRYDWLRKRMQEKKCQSMSQTELENYIREFYGLQEVTQKDYDRYHNISVTYCFQNENGVTNIAYQRDPEWIAPGEEWTWTQTEHSYDLWYLDADGKLGELIWQGGDGVRPTEEALEPYGFGINKELLVGFLASLAFMAISAAAAWKLQNGKWRKLSMGIAVYAASMVVFLLLGTGFCITQSMYLLRGDFGRDLMITTVLLTGTTLFWLYRRDLTKKETF